MCNAITYRPNDAPAPCCRAVEESNPLGLCYYHNKMFHGHLTPFFEEASVRTSEGTSVYSPNSLKKRRKK